MQITYLGHAGFYIETESTIIIMDPWLSKHGAFDSSWFQFPKNHHMQEFVQQKLDTQGKDKYIYISHEHKDHFDLPFLKSLRNRDFSFIVAKFVNPAVKNIFLKSEYRCNGIIELSDSERFDFKDGFLSLFLIDMELDCDSAILVRAEGKAFLNLNDCKVHDRLQEIENKYGQIDILTEQFSGAMWHPTCYKMEPETYKKICEDKKIEKFEMVANSIALLKPSMYLPSAGPPCFLDPVLYHINLQEVNTYPRASHFLKYLDQRFQNVLLPTTWPHIEPGDTLNLDDLVFTNLATDRSSEERFEAYLEEYKNEYVEYFKERALAHAAVDAKQVFTNLRSVLEEKLHHLDDSRKNIQMALYWSIEEYPDEIYHVNFLKGIVTIVDKVDENGPYYIIKAPGWQVKKVLDGKMSWQDFSFTFRVTLQRSPDIYNTLLHAYLTLDSDRLGQFCKLFSEVISKNERIKVNLKGKEYSVLRYCPHQGGDLMYGSIEGCHLVCPRHRWKFDLENEGRCLNSDATIKAICETATNEDHIKKAD